VALHQHADSIVWLKLSRNPMIELPLDFIQSCVILCELHLTHMSMKKVPQGIRHSTTLQCLHLSSNCIRDLNDASLDRITGRASLSLHNNRLEKLPSHFPRLRQLLELDISNNKFETFPTIVTQLESLRDLSVSFNTITEFPEEIGKMKTLETFFIVRNQFSKFPNEAAGMASLRLLDCRRNAITDLSVICMLPKIHTLLADYNVMRGLDLSIGPHLVNLVASHSNVTQLSLAPGPMGKPPNLSAAFTYRSP
jgi:adenylate cyclase